MKLDRRSFLKGLLAATALTAVPVGKLGYKYFQTVGVAFQDIPLEAFGNRIPNIAFEVGRVIGDQLFPEASPDREGPRLVDLDTDT
jgi:hypothetical protein